MRNSLSYGLQSILPCCICGCPTSNALPEHPIPECVHASEDLYLSMSANSSLHIQLLFRQRCFASGLRAFGPFMYVRHKTNPNAKIQVLHMNSSSKRRRIPTLQVYVDSLAQIRLFASVTPGQSSMVSILNRESHSRGIFEGIPDTFEVARYHSLYGVRDKLPDVLRPTAITADGVVSLLLFDLFEGWQGR